MLATVATASAAEFYVDARNTSGTEQGTQQSPFRTVQRAIDAAAGGDEIRVAGGTYVQNLKVVSKAIVLNGGFSSAWVRDVAANPTTLQGEGGDSVITLLDADATVDGFRITGGTGSTEELPDAYAGGGIFSRGGSPTITNNVIEFNNILSENPPADVSRGGGVYITNAAQARIENNVIRNNKAGRGSGVAIEADAALIKGNTIENNESVGDHGGGLFVAVVNATITQNVIRRNEVGRELGYGWGGGLIVVNTGNFAEISYNLVYENFASGYGAGEFIDEGASANIHHELIYRNVSKDGCETVSAIALDGGEGVGSRATISHCTVVNNVCPDSVRGNGLQVEGRSAATVVNCLFWNNGGDDFGVDPTSSLTVTFTDSQEGFPGAGNISADPRFVNEAADDYRLAAGSPCIGAANPTPFGNEAGDASGPVDMGRFGNTVVVTPGSAPSDNVAANNAVTGGGGGSGGAAQPASGDAPPGSSAVASTALCPAAGGLMLSLSLIGAGRAYRRMRPAAPQPLGRDASEL